MSELTRRGLAFGSEANPRRGLITRWASYQEKYLQMNEYDQNPPALLRTTEDSVTYS